ncbi:DapH/DapD/GlmU-related protein [Enterobacter cloacae complex sp. ESBL7]|uniref:DapH/DapD/GlmU-related protein n=1 Tax=Enterobacter cloacae complex sp. ESBL7 TaxID=3163325 RepID=UPI003564D04E
MINHIRYFIYSLKTKACPRMARHILNTSFLSKKKKFKLLNRAGVFIDLSSTIADNLYFEFGRIKVCKNVFINANCTFLDSAEIIIKNNSMIGPNVTLSTVTHHANPEHRHSDNIIAPICIGENVWIGANCTVLPGVTIGTNSVIAANSVVTTDVPDNVLFAGAPAILKKRFDINR